MEHCKRFLKYLEFKGKCLQFQIENPIGLDMGLVEDSIKKLEVLEQEKITELKSVMPDVPKYVIRKYPKITHKKDGTPSSNLLKWQKLCKEQGLPVTHKEDIQLVARYEEPNPGSHQQVKDWLFSLGWNPCTFDHKKDKDGNPKKVPQISNRDKELTESVLQLSEEEPKVKIFEGLSMLQHRLGLFKGFKECAIERRGQWFITAETQGLTNTLRFKHKKPLCNLPGVDKPWGKEIRGSLIAPEGYTFVGCDVVSLESTTKRHYIYPIDPEYAEEMSQPGFDEHLDLAYKQKALTKDEMDYYKWVDSGKTSNYNGPDLGTDSFAKVKKIRKKFKPVNYSAVYGIGVSKLARELKCSRFEAKKMLKGYWERNWSVKELVSRLKVKETHGYQWLLNPVSGFWYQLRFDKDKFSTLNQGTGVYIFDSLLARASLESYYGNLQFHDETGSITKAPDKVVGSLNKACERLNNDLDLNVKIEIDTQIGKNYAEVH